MVEHITAELAPLSGHDVLIYPMKQMGQEATFLFRLDAIQLVLDCTSLRRF